MATSIYVSTSEPHSGKSVVCLGIMEMVLRKTRRAAIFRPLIHTKDKKRRDKNIELLRTYFKLDVDYDDCYAYTADEANELIAKGHYEQVIDNIIAKFRKLQDEYDFVLVEGSDFSAEGSSMEANLNVDVPRNLGIPVLLIGRGDKKAIPDIIRPITVAIEAFLEKNCEVISVVVNRSNASLSHELLISLKNVVKKGIEISIIPEDRVLLSPTVKEIAEYLEAEVLLGQEYMQNQVHRYSIAAMQLQNYLEHITENCMVITPGDRGDIIISAMQAHISKNYPNISAILLTTGFKPSEMVMKLLEGLPQKVPLLFVKTNTYETSSRISTIHSYITADNQTKIDLSLSLFERYIDTETLDNKIKDVKVRGLTPQMFEYNITQQAKAAAKHIVLPEGTDERILKATEFLINNEIVKITLLGNESEIQEAASRAGVSLDKKKVNIVQPNNDPRFFDYVESIYQRRKEKGVNLDMAKDMANDVSYFGTMMVLEGDADGMVSGAIHTTQHTVRPALQLIKTKPGVNVVSSIFLMCLEDRVLAYGDCAINPSPDAQQLAEIAISSAETAAQFNIEPRIAMLSYSSGASGKGAEVEKVREATKIAKEKRPDLLIEGPIQYDAAVDYEVGQKKMPGSKVAGKATVLIFPDLNTGNNTYKAVQRETKAIAIGPVLQGLNKPVNDLSRGCTVKDIINTVIITAIQASQ